jgi:hypothetical protein
MDHAQDTSAARRTWRKRGHGACCPRGDKAVASAATETSCVSLAPATGSRVECKNLLRELYKRRLFSAVGRFVLGRTGRPQPRPRTRDGARSRQRGGGGA